MFETFVLFPGHVSRDCHQYSGDTGSNTGGFGAASTFSTNRASEAPGAENAEDRPVINWKVLQISLNTWYFCIQGSFSLISCLAVLDAAGKHKPTRSTNANVERRWG